MADFYVNINDGNGPDPAYIGTGHAGTELDPFSWDDFDSHSKSGNIYYFEGYKKENSSTINYNGISFEVRVWNLLTKGPWRFNVETPLRMNNATVNDGLIISGSQLELGAANRMYIDHDATPVFSFTLLNGGINNSNTIIERTSSISPNYINPGSVLNSTLFITYSSSPFNCATSLTTFNDVATNVLTEPDLAIGVSGGSVSVTGTTDYNISVPPLVSLPTWTNSDLTQFDLYSNFGVGDPGGWAAPPSVNEYWVDFDVASTGNDGLSPTNYWGWDEFETHYATTMDIGDIFNCRGMKIQVANLIAKTDTNNTIRDWDVDLYGPWRIYGANTYYVQTATGTGNINTILENGIIEGKYVGRGHINNYMYFKSNTGANYINSSPVNTEDNYCTFSYQDSILGPSGTTSTASSALNCVFSTQVFGATVSASSFNSWNFHNSGVTNAPVYNYFVNTSIIGGVYINTGLAYNQSLSATPTWNDTDLTQFDLYAGEGVGAPGGWAAPSIPSSSSSPSPESSSSQSSMYSSSGTDNGGYAMIEVGQNWNFIGAGNSFVSPCENPSSSSSSGKIEDVKLERVVRVVGDDSLVVAMGNVGEGCNT